MKRLVLLIWIVVIQISFAQNLLLKNLQQKAIDRTSFFMPQPINPYFLNNAPVSSLSVYNSDYFDGEKPLLSLGFDTFGHLLTSGSDSYESGYLSTRYEYEDSILVRTARIRNRKVLSITDIFYAKSDTDSFIQKFLTPNSEGFTQSVTESNDQIVTEYEIANSPIKEVIYFKGDRVYKIEENNLYSHTFQKLDDILFVFCFEYNGQNQLVEFKKIKIHEIEKSGINSSEAEEIQILVSYHYKDGLVVSAERIDYVYNVTEDIQFSDHDEYGNWRLMKSVDSDDNEDTFWRKIYYY